MVGASILGFLLLSRVVNRWNYYHSNSQLVHMRHIFVKTPFHLNSHNTRLLPKQKTKKKCTSYKWNTAQTEREMLKLSLISRKQIVPHKLLATTRRPSGNSNDEFFFSWKGKWDYHNKESCLGVATVYASLQLLFIWFNGTKIINVNSLLYLSK